MDLWRTWLARSPEEREVGVRFLGDPPKFADMAELVDALVLGTSDFGRGGSSPFIRTKFNG